MRKRLGAFVLARCAASCARCGRPFGLAVRWSRTETYPATIYLAGHGRASDRKRECAPELLRGAKRCGRIAPGGVLPVNTNGGGLSCVHPGMYGIFTVIEAARQIRGDAPGIQSKDIDLALAHGNGGVLSSQVTAILGSQNTL